MNEVNYYITKYTLQQTSTVRSHYSNTNLMNAVLKLLKELYAPKFAYKTINAVWHVESILHLCAHSGISRDALVELGTLYDGKTFS
jgi:hypothetical protein